MWFFSVLLLFYLRLLLLLLRIMTVWCGSYSVAGRKRVPVFFNSRWKIFSFLIVEWSREGGGGQHNTQHRSGKPTQWKRWRHADKKYRTKKKRKLWKRGQSNQTRNKKKHVQKVKFEIMSGSHLWRREWFFSLLIFFCVVCCYLCLFSMIASFVCTLWHNYCVYKWRWTKHRC